MFVLSPTEFRDLRSQFVISKADRTRLRPPPMAFTEQGVAMLSSVLTAGSQIFVGGGGAAGFAKANPTRRVQIVEVSTSGSNAI